MMMNYLIFNDSAKRFQKVNREDLDKISFEENSLKICIEYPTDTDGITRQCNIGYYDANKKSINFDTVNIGNVTIKSIALKCFERSDDDYSLSAFTPTPNRLETYLVYDFVINIETNCPHFHSKIRSYSDRLHKSAYYDSRYRYGYSYTNDVEEYAEKIGSKEYSYVERYEDKKESFFGEWQEPLLNRLVKDVNILNSALNAGFYPKELDLFRFHSDSKLDDNSLLSKILSNIKVEDNFIVFPVKLQKTYACEILSIVFDGKVYADFTEDIVYCSIPVEYQNQDGILHKLKTDIFFEYISNYSYKETKIRHIIAEKKYKELVSEKISNKKYNLKKTTSYEQKRDVIHFLMSISCSHTVKGYIRVGRDDMEDTTKSIMLYSPKYKPNNYCVDIMKRMLHCDFENKEDSLVWEKFESEYVAGCASDSDSSLRFLEEQMKSIIDFFTYRILNSDNSDWEKAFY